MSSDQALKAADAVQQSTSLEDFLVEEWPRLIGTLVLFTGNPTLAEDLAQETAARVCRDWHKVSRMDRPGAWAYRVAMNLAKSHLRRRAATDRAYRRHAHSLDAAAATPDPATALAVRAEVLALPPKQRCALVLRYFADLSVAETAHAMRCPEGTVKTLTRNAILSLRQRGLVDPSPSHEDGHDG